MNVEILRYDRHSHTNESSTGEFLINDDKKIIGMLAQIILNYATFDVKLPASVVKL